MPRYLAFVLALAAATVSASTVVVAVAVNRAHRWVIVSDIVAIDTWKDRVCLIRAQWNELDRSGACRAIP